MSVNPTFPAEVLAARFWPNVRVDDSGCWLWAPAAPNGTYGRFRALGRRVGAHRVAYTALKGPIPDGLELDHLCRRPPCVNPAHLEPTTHRENVLRGVAPAALVHKSTTCGRGHPKSKRTTQVKPDGTLRCRRCHTDWEMAANPARGPEGVRPCVICGTPERVDAMDRPYCPARKSHNGWPWASDDRLITGKRALP